jgi:uncharacterized OsmC-like protein
MTKTVTLAKTLPQVLKEMETSISGLRIEVEGWRRHTGSTGEFILLEIDRLLDKVKELKAVIK